MELRFCEWLESIRKEGCYSIKQVADLAKLPSSTVGSHIRGEKFPKVNTFVKYMRAFGVPYIWDETPSPPGPEYAKQYDIFLSIEDKYKNFYKEDETDEVL